MVYGFDDFRRDVVTRVRLLNRRLPPDGVWPAVLLLDAPDGLQARAFDVGPDARSRDELAERLPAELAEARARRFALVLSGWRSIGDERQECLLVIVAERGRAEVLLAPIYRGEDAPALGVFSTGAYGRGARRVAGRLVEPLLAAVGARPPLRH